MRRNLVKVASLVSLIGVFGVAECNGEITGLGVDLLGGKDDYLAGSNATNFQFTWGYEFSINESAHVTGLGFWHLDVVTDPVGSTEIGLWDTSQNLLLSVVATQDNVDSFATAIGWGYWNFADVSYDLEPGTYVVGAWSEDLDFTYSRTVAPDTANGVTFESGRYAQSAGLSFPATVDTTTSGNYGGNIRFSQVPEPTSLALVLCAGLLGAVILRRQVLAASHRARAVLLTVKSFARRANFSTGSLSCSYAYSYSKGRAALENRPGGNS